MTFDPDPHFSSQIAQNESFTPIAQIDADASHRSQQCRKKRKYDAIQSDTTGESISYLEERHPRKVRKVEQQEGLVLRRVMHVSRDNAPVANTGMEISTVSQNTASEGPYDVAVSIPIDFVDPISRLIMSDPVVSASGITYERESIETWLKTSDIDPCTATKLAHKYLNPNTSIKSQIGDFLAKHTQFQKDVYVPNDKTDEMVRLLSQCDDVQDASFRADVVAQTHFQPTPASPAPHGQEGPAPSAEGTISQQHTAESPAFLQNEKIQAVDRLYASCRDAFLKHNQFGLGRNLFHIIFQTSNASVVRHVVNLFAAHCTKKQWKQVMRDKDSKGFVPCHYALINPRVEVFQYVCNDDRFYPLLSQFDMSHITEEEKIVLLDIFFYCCEYGYCKGIKLLHSLGVDINQPKQGWYPLELASFEGRLSVVKLLWSLGTHSCKAAVSDAFCAAAESNHIPIIRWMLQKGVDVNSVSTKYNFALERAASKENLEMIKLLLENKADVNLHYRMSSALSTSAHIGSMPAIQLLVSRGALVDPPNSEDAIPLNVAAEHGHYEICEFLLEHGADPNRQNQVKCTGLHYAIENCDYRIIRLILNYGGSIAIQDHLGESCWDLAVSQKLDGFIRNHMTIVKQVRRHLKRKEIFPVQQELESLRLEAQRLRAMNAKLKMMAIKYKQRVAGRVLDATTAPATEADPSTVKKLRKHARQIDTATHKMYRRYKRKKHFLALSP